MKPENYSEMQNVVFFESIDSTNEAAKRLAKEAEDGTLVVADHQSAGKGRKGREWISPAGKNLYFSLLLKPTFSPEKASMLTLVMAVAVKRAIDELCVGADVLEAVADAASGSDSTAEAQDKMAEPLQIKWPNDIVAGGKKLVGILTEMQPNGSAIDYVIIGVGVNVKKQVFPQDTCAYATDIETVFGREISRKELLSKIRQHFTDAYACFLETLDLSGLLSEYNKALVNANSPVKVLDPAGEFFGVAKGINEKGELMVQTDNGVVNVYAGEVSVRGVYGYV